MHLDFNDLKQIPEFQQLLSTVEAQAKELKILRSRHLKWVNSEQAQEITGLSRRSLLRERQNPDSLIVFKEDHGVRYDYDSLLKHKESRAHGRGRLAQLQAG
jgi:hypothetical protein